jgi:hypothetical protein
MVHGAPRWVPYTASPRAADRLAGAALEQHVVRHHHRGLAVLGQDGHHVLQEIELVVRGRDKEVLPIVILALGLDLAVVADDAIALLFPKGRVRQHHIESFPAGAE